GEGGGTVRPDKPRQAESQHDGGCDDPQTRRGEWRGAEKWHRDRILNRRRPGRADIVKVEVPSMIAAGIKRRGMDADRNNACAMGTSTKKATNRLTPP